MSDQGPARPVTTTGISIGRRPDQITGAATRIGAIGSPWRGTVDGRGRIAPDGARPLDWWVLADDRWHTPASDAAVRQRRPDGTPVTETIVRVPGGDVIQRIAVVAAHGGLTVVEVENASAHPVAVAFSHGDLLSSRTPSALPVEGITLPPGAAVFPVPHRQTVRVALAHDGRRGPLPADVPTADAVARGWCAHLARRGRVVVPEPGWSDRIMSAAALVALDGMGDERDRHEALARAAVLVELGEPAEPLVEVVAELAWRLAKESRRATGAARSDAAVALAAAAGVLRQAGEPTAAGDVLAMAARLEGAAASDRSPADRSLAAARVATIAATAPERPGWLLALIRTLVVDDRRPGELDLLPIVPATWFGAPIEVHDLPTAAGRVGFAVRWHGARPALLWQLEGAARLRCRGLDASWTDERSSAEALLAAPDR